MSSFRDKNCWGLGFRALEVPQGRDFKLSEIEELRSTVDVSRAVLYSFKVIPVEGGKIAYSTRSFETSLIRDCYHLSK